MKSIFIKPFWFGYAPFELGFIVAVAIYPLPYQLTIGLKWPNYLPLLIGPKWSKPKGGKV